MRCEYEFEIEVADQEYFGTALVEFIPGDETGQPVEAELVSISSLATYDQADGSLVTLNPRDPAPHVEEQILESALDKFTSSGWKKLP